MNKEWKEKWLKALRSGEYEQGRRRLVSLTDSRQSFCCLGVLGDLAVKEGLAEWKDGWYRMGLDQKRSSEMGLTLMPDNIAKTKFGLTDKQQSKLVNMNDTGYNFVEIADYIEENL